MGGVDVVTYVTRETPNRLWEFSSQWTDPPDMRTRTAKEPEIITHIKRKDRNGTKSMTKRTARIPTRSTETNILGVSPCLDNATEGPTGYYTFGSPKTVNPIQLIQKRRIGLLIRE